MMKKLHLLIFTIISFISISSVNAETLIANDYGSFFDDDVSFYLSHQNDINELIDVWNDTLSMQYPYYYIKYVVYFDSSFEIALVYSDKSDILADYNTTQGYITTANSVISVDNCIDTGSCNTRLDNFILYKSSDDSFTIYNSSNRPTSYSGSFPYIFGTSTSSPTTLQHLPLINHGLKFNNKTVRGYLSDSDSFGTYNSISFPTYTSSTYNMTIDSFNVFTNDVFPDIVSLYDGTYSPIEPNTYTEINLNDYDYVILSLKSYTPIDTQYSTTIYTHGSLCATPVYNYGMKEKKDYYSGYQVQGCTEYYNQLTPVSFYILPQDIENHAVYYIKSSNTYVTNTINVDNNIFNITYITSENSDNPSVIISGRSYPTIPYNNLTDTAIISSEEGYISGASCALGDVNCYYENNGMDISNLFTHPLQLLQSVWSSITTMFVMIFGFFSLLPPLLQSFMISAFMLAVLLGIIKIIIG